MGAEDFWENRSLVESYATDAEALGYEVDAIRSAVARASATGPVAQIHVVGVGAGRELSAIRAAAPAAHIHAWDISAAMVAACRAHVDRIGLREVTVRQRAVAELSLPAGAAHGDVAIALGAVLGYSTSAPAQHRALEAITGLLRPGAGLAAVVQQRYGRPDWAVWFAVQSLRQALGGAEQGRGNRTSRHGETSVRFHHFTRRELDGMLAAAGFDDIDIESLRQWGRRRGARMPMRSPNPLITTATLAV